jgi:hypothetical protein
MDRTPGADAFKKDAAPTYKMNMNIVAGNWYGGGPKAFQRLYVLQRELLADWMAKGEVQDDDQTTYILMYYREPQLFHLVRADWFDVFSKFSEVGKQLGKGNTNYKNLNRNILILLIMFMG